MDILKRLGDYLDTRRAHDQPEVTLDSIVKRGEGHIRKQRWLSAAGGAAGMLVFVVVGSLAFNSTDPISTEPDSAGLGANDRQRHHCHPDGDNSGLRRGTRARRRSHDRACRSPTRRCSSAEEDSTWARYSRPSFRQIPWRCPGRPPRED